MSENERSNEGVLWSPQAIRELQQWRRGLPAMVRQMVFQAMAGSQAYREKDIRFGITVGYDPDYDGGGIEDPASYPTAPANTFWVKLGHPEYAAAAGEQELYFTPYDPSEYRLCHHPSNEFVEEGTTVRLALVHGQYFIIPEGGGISLFRFELTNATTFAATIKTMEGSVVGTDIILVDSENVFIGVEVGVRGYCFKQGGVYNAIQAICNTGEEYF